MKKSEYHHIFQVRWLEDIVAMTTIELYNFHILIDISGQSIYSLDLLWIFCKCFLGLVLWSFHVL